MRNTKEIRRKYTPTTLQERYLRVVSRGARALLVIAIGAAMFGPTAKADSIIDDTLSNIEAVQIIVQTASLTYHPLPNLDLRRLNEQVVAEVATVLKAHGVQHHAASEQSVIVKFSKMDIPESSGRSVVKITVLLREPAMVKRHAVASASAEAVVVTTWDSWRWTLVTSADALEKLLGSVQAVADELGETVSAAREPKTVIDHHPFCAQ